MKCPECNGSGQTGLTMDRDRRDLSSTAARSLKALIIDCPTCEGEGELPDIAAVNHCPACGIPLLGGDRWCQIHQAAAGLE